MDRKRKIEEEDTFDDDETVDDDATTDGEYEGGYAKDYDEHSQEANWWGDEYEEDVFPVAVAPPARVVREVIDLVDDDDDEEEEEESQVIDMGETKAAHPTPFVNSFAILQPIVDAVVGFVSEQVPAAMASPPRTPIAPVTGSTMADDALELKRKVRAARVAHFLGPLHPVAIAAGPVPPLIYESPVPTERPITCAVGQRARKAMKRADTRGNLFGDSPAAGMSP